MLYYYHQMCKNDVFKKIFSTPYTATHLVDTLSCLNFKWSPFLLPIIILQSRDAFIKANPGFRWFSSYKSKRGGIGSPKKGMADFRS